MDMTCPKLPVKMDEHTEIACEVLSKTFAKITWFHNAQPISEQRTSHVRVDRKSCDQTLKIKFAMTSDGGNYTCQVANAVATVKKTCFLHVKGKSSLADDKVEEFFFFGTGLVISLIETGLLLPGYGGISEVSRAQMRNRIQNPEIS